MLIKKIRVQCVPIERETLQLTVSLCSKERLLGKLLEETLLLYHYSRTSSMQRVFVWFSVFALECCQVAVLAFDSTSRRAQCFVISFL
jgi:hypothetical protein